MALDSHGLLAAALSVRVTADTSGLDAELASKLTAAERRAQLTATSVSASAGKIAEVGTASSAKLEAATLRQTAAQEAYNRLLRAGESDTIRLARAQASLITAQSAVRREQTRLTEATAATAASGEAATVGLLGGTKGLIAGAAGLGLFTALHRGVQTYETLTGSVRQYQRVTGQTAEDSSRMVAILDRFGLSGDKATQAMLRFGKNISEQPQKLKEFGVQIARNADGTTNLSKTLLNANDAFHKTPDAATRASMALSLFGRGGQSLLPILASNRDTLQGFMDQAERSGVVFSQEDLNRAKELAMSQRDMTQAWQGFEILLARGLVPVLHEVDRVGTSVLNLFTEHRTIGLATIRVGEVAGALYAVNKAIKTFDSVRGSALFTKVLNVGGTQAQTAANLELAGSYGAIGAAAAAATPEVAALDAAEVAGGAAGGVGVLGEMAALRATIPTGSRFGYGALTAGLSARIPGVLRAGAVAASAIDPAILAAAFAGPGGGTETKGQLSADDLFKQNLGQFTYRNGAYYAGGVMVTDPRVIAELHTLGAAVHGAPASVANSTDVSSLPKLGLTSGQANALLGGYLQTVATGGTKQQQTVAAQQQATQAGLQYAGGVDIFSRAPRIGARDPQALQAVTAAQTRAADAARRVQLDEQNLNRLRSSGKATALQLASAEETLRLAKERSAKASQDVTDAEKKAATPRLATAQSLLKTLTSQENRSALDAKAVERLYAAGVDKNVVGKILTQNATAPGTLERVAATVTPALAQQLDRKFRQLAFDGSVIAGSPRDWRKAGNDRAEQFLAGAQAVFNNSKLTAPLRAARLDLASKGRTGSYDPSGIDGRARALSGTPSLPHGA